MFELRALFFHFSISGRRNFNFHTLFYSTILRKLINDFVYGISWWQRAINKGHYRITDYYEAPLQYAIDNNIPKEKEFVIVAGRNLKKIIRILQTNYPGCKIILPPGFLFIGIPGDFF